MDGEYFFYELEAFWWQGVMHYAIKAFVVPCSLHTPSSMLSSRKSNVTVKFLGYREKNKDVLE